MIIAVRVAIADHGVAVGITAKGIAIGMIGAIGLSAVSERNDVQSQKNSGFSPVF
jgi:F0F1-type ATP synthase membrane subunit c/vacuolar-type H+-ATPase subunit K